MEDMARARDRLLRAMAGADRISSHGAGRGADRVADRRRAEFRLRLSLQLFWRAGLALRFAAKRRAWLDDLKLNAFGMYLVHYVFVIWLQYALLPAGLPAIVKAAIVFAGTLVLSWGTTAALRHLPPAAAIVVGGRVAANPS